LFCFEKERTCKSLNYAEPTSVNDGEENCELHDETKNDEDNSLEFLKDDRYTFYQITENIQKTDNETEQVYIHLPSPASKLNPAVTLFAFSNNGKERTVSTNLLLTLREGRCFSSNSCNRGWNRLSLALIAGLLGLLVFFFFFFFFFCQFV
jgi:hypothetical protein